MLIFLQIVEADFHKFDYIFGMDYSNIEELNDMAPKGCKAKVEMLGKYDYDRPDIIKDPYFVSLMLFKFLDIA